MNLWANLHKWLKKIMASPEEVYQLEILRQMQSWKESSNIGQYYLTIEVQQESDLSNDAGSPWDRILSAAMFALRANYHGTLQATPCQLVQGRDAMVNVKFEANWQLIKQRKQWRIYETMLGE